MKALLGRLPIDPVKAADEAVRCSCRDPVALLLGRGSDRENLTPVLHAQSYDMAKELGKHQYSCLIDERCYTHVLVSHKYVDVPVRGTE